MNGITDTMRLDWLLDNLANDFECVELIAGNLDRYHVEASREAIDKELLRDRPTPQAED